MTRKFIKIPALILLAFFSAVNYSVFIFPNTFAPAGIDGICTMIQDISNVSMGYLALLVNIPLLISAFFVLNREFAVNSTVYVITFSVSAIWLNYIDISQFQYVTNTGTSIVLAPIAAGTIRGILYSLTLKINGSSGGVDIIAALVKHKKPHLNLMNTIFFFNIFVAISSFFVYGMKPEPVICGIIYAFITSSISNKIRKGETETIKFEIITPKADVLCHEISQKLNQTATIMEAQGAYSNSETKMVICVAKKEKAPFIENLILEHPECVVFKSIVSDNITGADYK